jgi:hypothetical protein
MKAGTSTTGFDWKEIRCSRIRLEQFRAYRGCGEGGSASCHVDEATHACKTFPGTTTGILNHRLSGRVVEG